MSRTRSSALLAAAALLVGCGGSGGSKEAGSTTSAPPSPAATTPTQTTTTSTSAKPSRPSGVPPSHGQTVTTPENGGTEPARNPVTISVTRLGVSTPEVRVAPFIAVAITLRSSDGSAHVARVAGKVLRVSSGRRDASVTLPGLPTGKSYSVAVDGFKPVRVVSSAEPGP